MCIVMLHAVFILSQYLFIRLHISIFLRQKIIPISMNDMNRDNVGLEQEMKSWCFPYEGRHGMASAAKKLLVR